MPILQDRAKSQPTCSYSPMNGLGSRLTEGARINSLVRGTSFPSVGTDSCSSCPPYPSVAPPITPAESSYINSFTVVQDGMTKRCETNVVTQDRAKELLAASRLKRQFGSESVRIQNVIDVTESCQPPIQFYSPIIIPVCPITPAPPAPPARACPLSKDQKLS